MGFVEYSEFDGLGLAELVKAKKISPAELVEAAIERIELHNPLLNAVVFKGYEDARAKAARELSGPFAGVPMLLKNSRDSPGIFINSARPSAPRNVFFGARIWNASHARSHRGSNLTTSGLPGPLPHLR